MTTDLSRRSNVSGAEPLAVLGMALRLPGAPDEEALWQVLTAGLPVSGAPPEDRWALREAERPVRAGFLPDIFDFDCELFSVSPREAALLDPQLRLFLELAWLACDDAGRGGAGIAVKAGAPILPIAHNAGRVWPAKSLIIHPGVVTLHIGALINTHDRDPKQLSEEVGEWIEARCSEMP